LNKGKYMNDMTLLPVNSGMGAGGAAGIGGAIGGLIGSAFSRGWGGWGGCGAPVAASAAVADTALMTTMANNINTSFDTLTQQINNLGLATIQGNGATNLALANAASGIQNSLCSGFAGITQAVTAGTAANIAVTNQGFNSLSAQCAQSACSIERSIANEGAATRALQTQYQIQQLQSELCDSKASNAALKSEVFTANALAAQAAAFDFKLNNAVNTIVSHIPVNSCLRTCHNIIPANGAVPATA
jgi:hypothetical protein